jgi:hypothetical protein
MATPLQPGTGRYIVRIDDREKLKQFIRSTGSMPEVKVVDQIGPPGAPHTVVVEMPHGAKPSLEQHLRSANTQFIIEPDRNLSLF